MTNSLYIDFAKNNLQIILQLETIFQPLFMTYFLKKPKLYSLAKRCNKWNKYAKYNGSCFYFLKVHFSINV